MSKKDKKKNQAREPWEQSIYEPDQNGGGSRLAKTPTATRKFIISNCFSYFAIINYCHSNWDFLMDDARQETERKC